MIIHVAAMVALFVDQVQQAPVVVQCSQPAPEKWWRPLSQFAQTIIPVAGGVWIAWLAFRWTGNKERSQWVRDQKKLEWRELLDLASDCQVPLHIASTPKDRLEAAEQAVVTDSELRLLKIDQIFDTRLFINQSVLGPLRSKWREARVRAIEGSESSNDEIAGGHSLLLHSILIKALREAAKKDLGIGGGLDEL
jgi:hypothetical protein